MGIFNFRVLLVPSATDALVTLKWLNLEQRRFNHCCIYIYKCINGLMDHSMNLLANSDIHNYNTRNKDMLNQKQTMCGSS